MLKRVLILFYLLGIHLGCSSGVLNAQTGPNSPQTRANNTSIGVNAWSTPAQILSSNNTYASCSTKGITNYVSGTNFNFAIPVPSSISGIVLEIERSTTSSTAVAVLDNWTTGTSKTISSGVARCLIVSIFMENGLGPRNVTALTYGGQNLTQITEAFVGSGSGFCGKIEYWRLMETEITAAIGTSFVLTFDGTSLLENWEAVSSAVYQFVDQTIPVSDIRTTLSNTTTNPITLSPSLNTLAGGMSVSGVFCGNNTTPASTIGGTNTYNINSSFTEVVDTYSANSGFSTSGGSFEVAHKATVASGTESPAFTFAGTVNRQMAICIHLQSIREADHSVRLVKGGVITGNNYAQTTSAWSTTDAYTSYGTPTDLWGTTWADSDINATTFGAVLSATVQNGTARVDHMRITIYSFSTLPIELLNFTGNFKDGKGYLYWQTATEKNNKEFAIERSRDGINFDNIGSVPGKGNSQVLNNYNFVDISSSTGLNYYRLKQIDTDDSFKYYKTIVIDNTDSNQELLVFPNPSSNGLYTIKSGENSVDGVTIYSVDMKLIKQIGITSGELNLSLEELADGLYNMIFTTNGTQKVKRLLKSTRGN
ncbi:T9SS type A sorting domain-containing protein [Aurantibacillus circumpalustris]|uniref:T9SS type A sorting domain-containing protein n=1 Tax=Aurantibacillus circumpalustris TaxID=3036359 RepID=UPI00295B3F12|nr:T9SS type A sorting domain-containing protein [Aurantibacillus circumpalustris]